MSEKKDLRDELGESVHKIWLAGLGALSSAGEEGAKLFKNLVEKGEDYERRGRQRYEDVKTRVEDRAEQAKEQAGSTWDKVEERMDETVAGALARLGVPSRDEIATLTRRVEELTTVVEKLKSSQPAAEEVAAS